MPNNIIEFNKETLFLASSEVNDCCYPYELRVMEINDQYNGNRQIMLFHFGIWARMNPEVKFSFLAKIEGYSVISVSGIHLWVCFSKKSDRTKFEKWISKYGKSFGDKSIHEHYFPPFPNGIRTLVLMNNKSGVFYDVSMDSYAIAEGFLDKWLWIMKNCKKPIYVSSETIAFENPNDAIFYKCRWC